MPTAAVPSGPTTRMQLMSRRMLRNAEIARGEALPTLGELLSGICPFRDSLAEDIDVWCLKILSDPSVRIPDAVRTALEFFRKFPNKTSAGTLLARLQTPQALDLLDRIPWYAAVMGDMAGWSALRAKAVGEPLMLLYLSGLKGHAEFMAAYAVPDHTSVLWQENANLDILRAGASHAEKEIAAIRDAADFVSLWEEGGAAKSRRNADRASTRRAGPDPFVPVEPCDFRDEDAAVGAFLEAEASELGRGVRRPSVPDRAPTGAGLVVLRKPNATGTREQKDFLASFDSIADKALPFLPVRDLADVRERLLKAWPHAGSVVDRLLSPLVEGAPVRFDSVILVGDPGSGKSRLMREIGAAFGQVSELYPCGSVADGSFAGTPAQWSSKRVSVPLALVRSSGRPNPLVVLDEIEKTAASRAGANGSLLSAILPFVDRDSSSRVFDTALETSVDLSMVSYLATSNDASLLPPEVRDRFTILRMPNPEAAHVPVLARRVMDDHAAALGMDPRFLPDLEQDELRIILKAWDGGSIRKLKGAVKATLEARSAYGIGFAN